MGTAERLPVIPWPVTGKAGLPSQITEKLLPVKNYDVMMKNNNCSEHTVPRGVLASHL